MNLKYLKLKFQTRGTKLKLTSSLFWRTLNFLGRLGRLGSLASHVDSLEKKLLMKSYVDGLEDDLTHQNQR